MEINTSGIIIAAICVIYGIVLYNLTGRHKNTGIMLKAFAFISIIGWIMHMMIFHIVAGPEGRSLLDWILMVYFSAQYTLEMFVAKTLIFKAKIAAAIPRGCMLYDIYFLIYYLAVITSALVIFNFISRWAYSRRWLERSGNIKAAAKGGNHIFVGINHASITLARNIRKDGDKGKIIFIDIPENERSLKGLSIWDIISRFFSHDDNYEDINADVILRSSKVMKGLLPWLSNKDNNLYILSDDYDANIRFLEQLWQYEHDGGHPECHIYCHADKEGLVSRYDTITDIHDRITFIDSSYLSIESLKSHENPAMYPISYVDVGTDPESGRKLGWVAGGFTSAILGFGETGHEALKFLYEFGAFVGKDKNKAPFRCHIFDRKMTEVSGEFRKRIHIQDNEEVLFEECSTDNGIFWEKFDAIIGSVNYIMICLGDDMVNLKTAIDIAEFALNKGRDLNRNFIIAVKMQKYSRLARETLEKANKALRGCIKAFGMEEDIWHLKVLKHDDLKEKAMEFYYGYLAMTSEGDIDKNSWAEREERLRHDDYAVRNKARRQIAQNHSNCLHVATKKALCDSTTAEAAALILKQYDGTQHVDMSLCTGFDASVLDYLAIGEHLRWNASHIMLGYRYATETSDLINTHSCIVPYENLSEEIKHYDWLVVKYSLMP